MSKDEVISELCTKGIVAQIGDEFFITEKYKELLQLSESNKLQNFTPPPKLDYDKILNSNTNGNSWPTAVLESTGRVRAAALMDACEVPVVSNTGYRLRGLDTKSVNIIGNIVDNPDIDPPTFIDAITKYYQYTEMPKSMKNLMLDGDALDIYQEHLSGAFLKSLNSNQENNQKWG